MKACRNALCTLENAFAEMSQSVNPKHAKVLRDSIAALATVEESIADILTGAMQQSALSVFTEHLAPTSLREVQEEKLMANHRDGKIKS